MNQYRIYDIVAENDNGEEYHVDNEFMLYFDEHDNSTAMQRQEFVGIMFDTVVSVSGLNVCSFSSQPVNH